MKDIFLHATFLTGGILLTTCAWLVFLAVVELAGS